MASENLVLVHSFPTNSILLRGLVDYLGGFFRVHFIDLPGFTRDVPPLEKISLEGYVRFVDERIQQLELDDYIAAGVSFGFLVVNAARHDDRCRGILGMVPYLGRHSLRMNALQRWYYRTLVGTICRLGIGNVIWRSWVMRRYLSRTRKYCAEVQAAILDQIDPRTFFETALLLLSDDRQPVLQQRPYVFLPSTVDKTINYRPLQCLAACAAAEVLVIELEVEHYPQDLSTDYFRRVIPAQTVDRMKQFFACQSGGGNR